MRFGYLQSPESGSDQHFSLTLAMHSEAIATSSVDDLLWARLIFALGAAVTAATVVMIVRGHLYWRDREPSDAS